MIKSCMENKITKINKIIQSGQYLRNKSLILDFMKDNKLKYYFLDKLCEIKIDDFKKIDFLLKKLVKEKKQFALFNVLKNNTNIENNTYIAGFIFHYYDDFEESIAGKRIDRMFQEKALRIIKKIVETDEGQINAVLGFLAELLKKRKYKTRKPFDRKDDIEQEKRLIEKILLEISKKKGINRKLITLIKDNFTLISSHGTFFHTTPASIFDIIRQYIIESKNFEETFKEITQIILDQYLQLDLYRIKDGRNKFEGYEWIGGGISQAGSSFSVSDNHFVDYILKPALDYYYQKNPKKAFDFIKSFCVWKNKEGKIAITKKHPAFLLRACVGVLLREYKIENQEAENIINEFLVITRGIPCNTDLIFQEVYKGDCNLSSTQKYNLIKKQLSIKVYKNLPANVFVLKIITDLIADKHKEATKFFFELIKNSEIYKRIWHAEAVVIEMIEILLKNNPEKGLEGFKNYIQTDYFKNSLGTFDAYPVSNLLSSILRNPTLYKHGIEILQNLVKQQEPLTFNQQILICNSLIDSKGNSDSENLEVLMNIYDDFLWPLLSEELKKDLKKDYKNENYGLIYNKFPFSHARDKFVQFAGRLAKKKKIKQALDIIEIFVDDPDPFTPFTVDPNDKNREYDEHKEISQGKEMNSITTVRGWCGWVLLQCSGVESRSYIKRMIALTKRLIEDKNLYVASYGANALSGLTRNRLTVTPENRDVLFFGKDTETALNNAKQVEEMAFCFLKRIKNEDKKIQDGMSESLLHLFNTMRALSESDAKIFINSLTEMSTKTIAKAVPLFIYFAEFRQGNFKNWRWKVPELKLYDDLEEFNGKEFQEILEKVLKRGDPEINSQFAWHFWRLIAESVDDKAKIEDVLTYSKAFSIAYKYLEVISDYYVHLVFSHIFRFIEENLEKRPQDCYRLLVKSLKVEKKALEEKAKKEKPDFYDWYPHYRVGDILIKIKDNIGIKEMLEVVEFLLDYPKEVNTRMVSEFPSIMQDLPVKYNKNNRIEKIFDKLIKINPRYYDEKEAWKKKSRDQKIDKEKDQ